MSTAGDIPIPILCGIYGIRHNMIIWLSTLVLRTIITFSSFHFGTPESGRWKRVFSNAECHFQRAASIMSKRVKSQFYFSV